MADDVFNVTVSATSRSTGLYRYKRERARALFYDYAHRLNAQLKQRAPKATLVETSRQFRATVDAVRLIGSLEKDFIAAVKRLPLINGYIAVATLGKFVELDSRTITKSLCGDTLQLHAIYPQDINKRPRFGVIPEEFVNACTVYV